MESLYNLEDYFTFSLACWIFENSFLSIPPDCGWQDLGEILQSI